MCLTPIHLRTNAKYFSLNGYRRFTLDVPCGQCAECQQMKKNEWYLRNYYEAQDTWSKGGYILFDTLTYSDEYLPKLSSTLTGFNVHEPVAYLKVIDWMNENNLFSPNPSEDPKITSEDFTRVMSFFRNNDFSCFNYHDVQGFLKRLRINLSREGYDVKSCLRYFVVSEYGHEDSYISESGRCRKGTMRPHYHVLFYVSNPSLDPITLSSFICDAWYLGRTDGVYYKGRAYVYNNTFGPRYIKDPSRLAGVQMYVTKYVCKDYEFSEKIDSRIVSSLYQVYQLSPSDLLYSEKRRELHRFMDQFHRQSVGFGAQALLDYDVLESIFNRGVITVPDKKRVVKDIQVPMYYVRKLFQKCVRNLEGSLHWVWIDSGISWKCNMMSSKVELLATKMQDWYTNLPRILGDCFEGESRREKVLALLRGRTWKEYAEYVLFYKGRTYLNKMSLRKLSPSEVLRNSMYEDFSDYLLFKSKSGYYNTQGVFLSPDDVKSKYVIDDSVFSRFNGFDLIYNIYCASMRLWNLEKQLTYRMKLETSKRLKALGYKTSKVC